MSNETAMKIWGKVLDELCCTENPITGNRPCDNGVLCCKCDEPEVKRLYKERVAAATITCPHCGEDVLIDYHPAMPLYMCDKCKGNILVKGEK